MPPAGYFGYGGHRALKCTTWFCYHSVMTKMEIQCLNNVGRIIFGALMEHKQMSVIKKRLQCQNQMFISEKYYFWVKPVIIFTDD